MKAITEDSLDDSYGDLNDFEISDSINPSSGSVTGGDYLSDGKDADVVYDEPCRSKFLSRSATPARDVEARILDLSLLAAVALEQLQLIAAPGFSGDTLGLLNAIGMDETIGAGSAAAVLAYVRYELDHLERAGQTILDRLSSTQEMDLPDAVVRAYKVLTHIAPREIRSFGGRTAQRPGKPGEQTSERLSARECAVLALIAKGQSNKLVARALKITPETVKSHLKRIFIKLGSKTRAEAVMRAAELGFSMNPVAQFVPSREAASRTRSATRLEASSSM